MPSDASHPSDPVNPIPPSPREQAVQRIARETLGLQTLRSRGSDRLDFHDLAVWTIQHALERAYEAGQQATKPTHATCPTCGGEIQIRMMPVVE
mgnify:CR=1 FL=1